jgi:hypothetical protein
VAAHRSTRTEEREVRSDNPDLSPEANRLLTEELREAVGSDRVRVPAGSPQPGADRERPRSTLTTTLASNRLIVAVTFFAAVVVGVAVSLATGSWWAVVAAVGVHALGTVVVATVAIQLTTETEHASPEVAARLEEEGVADPDRVLSDLVEDFSPAPTRSQTADVVSTGANERTVRPEEEPARATAEQRTAMTPSSGPGPAAGRDSAVAALPWWVIVGLMAVSLAAPVVGDTALLWVVPAVTWPLCLGWIAFERLAQRHDADEERRGGHRPGPPAYGSLPRLLPIYVAVVVGTVLFMILMGVLVGAL